MPLLKRYALLSWLFPVHPTSSLEPNNIFVFCINLNLSFNSPIAVQGLKMNRGLPVRKSLEGVGKVLLVASGKGGVGKSTVSANLAASLSRLGKQVGLLDVDLYGPSIPRLMGLTGAKVESKLQNGKNMMQPLIKDKIKCMSMGFLVDEEAPIVWRGLMVMKAIEQLLFQVSWSPLDILVIDMPPGTGDTQLSISQQVVVDGALIVTTPQELALADARRAVAMFQKVQVPILGLVENMSSFKCPSCSECTPLFPVGREIPDVKRLASLPLEPSLALGSDTGQLSTSPAFDSLAKHIISVLKI